MNAKEAELRWLYADNYGNMVQQGFIPGPKEDSDTKEEEAIGEGETYKEKEETDGSSLDQEVLEDQTRGYGFAVENAQDVLWNWD